MFLKKLKSWPKRYLYLAPRGWIIKIRSNSDKKMFNLLSGKSIAIVGNSESIFGSNLGAEIESNDIIIRLNKGFVKKPADQGLRTNLIGLTPELSEVEIIDLFKPEKFLMLIPKMRHYKLFNQNSIENTLFYNFRYWLQDRRLIGRRPSSGFMAISWVVKLKIAKEINIYGFDFGATPTYYNPRGYKTPHNYKKEKDIILNWAKTGLINIKNNDYLKEDVSNSKYSK